MLHVLLLARHFAAAAAAHADTIAHTYTDTTPNTLSFAYSCAHCLAGTDSAANGIADSDEFAVGDRVSISNANAGTNTNADARADVPPDAHSVADPDALAHAYADTHAYTDVHTETNQPHAVPHRPQDRDTDRRTDPHPHAVNPAASHHSDPDAYRRTDTCADGTPASYYPHSHAESDSFRFTQTDANSSRRGRNARPHPGTATGSRRAD